MKNKKFCETTAGCWSHWHELLGVTLLVLATILTIITCNGFGIIAMFLVGLIMCCHKHLCGHCCHSKASCDSLPSGLDVHVEKKGKLMSKKIVNKAKPKA